MDAANLFATGLGALTMLGALGAVYSKIVSRLAVLENTSADATDLAALKESVAAVKDAVHDVAKAVGRHAQGPERLARVEEAVLALQTKSKEHENRLAVVRPWKRT